MSRKSRCLGVVSIPLKYSTKSLYFSATKTLIQQVYKFKYKYIRITMQSRIKVEFLFLPSNYKEKTLWEFLNVPWSEKRTNLLICKNTQKKLVFFPESILNIVISLKHIAFITKTIPCSCLLFSQHIENNN